MQALVPDVDGTLQPPFVFDPLAGPPELPNKAERGLESFQDFVDNFVSSDSLAFDTAEALTYLSEQRSVPFTFRGVRDEGCLHAKDADWDKLNYVPAGRLAARYFGWTETSWNNDEHKPNAW